VSENLPSIPALMRAQFQSAVGLDGLVDHHFDLSRHRHFGDKTVRFAAGLAVVLSRHYCRFTKSPDSSNSSRSASEYATPQFLGCW
jgi:hypothetical protein